MSNGLDEVATRRPSSLPAPTARPSTTARACIAPGRIALFGRIIATACVVAAVSACSSSPSNNAASRGATAAGSGQGTTPGTLSAPSTTGTTRPSHDRHSGGARAAHRHHGSAGDSHTTVPSGTSAPATSHTATTAPGITTTTKATAPTTLPISAPLTFSTDPSSDVGSAHNVLAAAAIAGASEWAVGVTYDAATNADRTLAELWNGGSWRVVPTPNVGTGHNELDGAAGSSPSDVWAVGRHVAPTGPLNPYGQERSLAEHWNGRSWSVVAVPTEGKEHNELDGVSVASSTSAWAVGHYDLHHLPSDEPLAVYWDGSSWQLLSFAGAQLPTGAHADFNATAAVPGASSAWAVGQKVIGTGGTVQTFAELCTTTSCSVVPTPDQGPYHNQLDGVTALSAVDAWAVGFYYTGQVDHALVEHWDGQRWQIVPSPDPLGAHYTLAAVAAVNANEVVAVGDYYAGVNDRALVEQWNGEQWSVVNAADEGSEHNELLGVAASGDGTVVAVGTWYDGRSDRTLAERARP
jgi:hypothetical protein